MDCSIASAEDKLRVGYRVGLGGVDDGPAIYRLYRQVAEQPGGLARSQAEVTKDYVHAFIEAATRTGIQQVARAEGGEVVGEIHAYPLGLAVFAHVLGNLTLAVSPRHQRRGVAALLLDTFVRRVRHCHPHIERVELIARESNAHAIRLYQRFGFEVEGYLKGRIRGVDGIFEADVPMAWHRSGGC